MLQCANKLCAPASSRPRSSVVRGQIGHCRSQRHAPCRSCGAPRRARLYPCSFCPSDAARQRHVQPMHNRARTCVLRAHGRAIAGWRGQAECRHVFESYIAGRYIEAQSNGWRSRKPCDAIARRLLARPSVAPRPSRCCSGERRAPACVWLRTCSTSVTELVNRRAQRFGGYDIVNCRNTWPCRQVLMSRRLKRCVVRFTGCSVGLDERGRDRAGRAVAVRFSLASGASNARPGALPAPAPARANGAAGAARRGPREASAAAQREWPV